MVIMNLNVPDLILCQHQEYQIIAKKIFSEDKKQTRVQKNIYHIAYRNCAFYKYSNCRIYKNLYSIGNANTLFCNFKNYSSFSEKIYTNWNVLSKFCKQEHFYYYRFLQLISAALLVKPSAMFNKKFSPEEIFLWVFSSIAF